MTLEVSDKLLGFTNAKDLWEATHDLFGVQSRAGLPSIKFPDDLKR